MKLTVQIQTDGQYNRALVKTDKPDKVKAAIQEIADSPYYKVNQSMALREATKKLFGNHNDFYGYIGFEGGNEYGHTGETFNSSGFRKFLKDFFEDNDSGRLEYIDDPDALQQISDTLTSRIADIVQEYEEMDVDNVQARSRVTIDAGDNDTLTNPELVKDAIMVGQDGAYKLQVQELEDADNLQELEERVKGDMKDVYENQVDARVNGLKSQIKTLQNKLDEEKREMFVEGLKMIGNMDNWKVQGDRIVYQKKLVPTTVKKRRDDTVYELTEEAKEKFYIEGLAVPIRKTVSKLNYEDAYHPNTLARGVCTGTFREDIRDALDKAVEQMQHIDLHDAHNNDAERDFKENFDKYTKDEEESDTGEVFRS